MLYLAALGLAARYSRNALSRHSRNAPSRHSRCARMRSISLRSGLLALGLASLDQGLFPSDPKLPPATAGHWECAFSARGGQRKYQAQIDKRRIDS